MKDRAGWPGAVADPNGVQLNGRVPATIAADALLGLLLPFWQIVIGIVIVIFVIGASVRLAGRGRSRMNTAIMVTGATLLGQIASGFALAAAILNAVFGFCLGCELYLLLARARPAGRTTPTTTDNKEEVAA